MAKKYKCRVEYLESTGTQWIDTGVNVDTSTDEIKLYFQLTETQNYKWLFGEYDNNARLGLGSGDGTDKRNFLYQQTATKVSDTQMYNTQHLFEINSNGGFLNGTKIRDYANFASTATIYLFNLNIDSPSDYRCKGKIWGYRHKRNGVLILDLIPVLDLSGKPAMYDKVSEKLFYNKGTGEFAYGRQIIPVEYLESVDAQYIATGVTGGLETEVVIDAMVLGYSENNTSTLFGNISGNIGISILLSSNGTARYSRFGSKAVITKNEDLLNVRQTFTINKTALTFGSSSYVFNEDTSFSISDLALFDIASTTDSYYSPIRVYSCQIKDNGTLIRDFIPCIDENLTPFMFDTVNCKVYLNAGTGQFKVGSNVEKVWGSKKLRRKLALALANLKKKRKYYCEVEYLESTGTQYIDLGVGVKANTVFKATFSIASTATGRSYFGARNSTNERFQIVNSIGIGGGYYLSNTVYPIANQKYEIEMHANGDMYLDGVKRNATTGTFSQVAFERNLWLFATNYYDSSVPPGASTFWKAQVFEGDVLVRDLIPVLDWNMTPCMFDRVTEQLFYNQATSGNDFSYGREIHYVDYLESTGVEYIDTGIKFDGANTKIELKTYEDSLTRRHSICGDDGNFFYYFRGTGNWAVGYNGTAANIDLYMSVGDNVFVMDKNNVYVNGVLAKTYTASSSVSAYNALLFNRKTSLVDNGAVTMYYCKIWNNSALVRDYIPAIDENGVGFMFDRVSHTCFLNQGTGAFKYPGREVEYLQSDGARAIVAGVTVDDTCGYDIKWMALNANDTIIMGTKGSGDSRWVLSGSNNPNVNLSWNTSYGSAGLGLNKIQTAQMNYLNDRKRILNDTPLLDITTTLVAAASTYNVGIFGGYWGSGTVTLYSTCRIYYAKISKGTGLIRDFVPMVKDGSPCLFDKIGGLYYFGTGTGTFTRGKIVEPEYE